MKLGIKNIFYIKRNTIALPYLNTKVWAVLPNNTIKVPLPITKLSGELSSSSQLDKNGLLYTVIVSASMPYSQLNDMLISKIEQGNYIFLVEDMNSNKYLIGSDHYRATLTSKHTIDKLNKNIITFEINHISPHGEIIAT